MGGKVELQMAAMGYYQPNKKLIVVDMCNLW